MERLTYKFPSLSLANFAANAVRKDGVGTVVNVQNGFVTVETTNAAAVNQITESVRGYEVFREAVAAPAGLPVRPANAVAARLVNYKVPMTFVKQYPLLKKKKDALPGSKIMWSKDDNDLDVIAAKDVDSYTKDGWVIIEKFSEETMEVEILEAKLTPNTGVPAGASQDKFKKAAAVVKKAGYKATLGKGVPAGAKSEEVEEEEEIIEKVKLTPDQLKKIKPGVKKDTKKEEIEEEEEEEIEEIAEQFGTDGTFATARFDGENSTVPVFCVTLNHKQYAAYGAKENMGSWSLFPVMATEDKNLVISKEAIATDVSAKNLFNRLYAGLISIHENFVASKGLSEDYKATLKGVRKVKIVKPVAFAKLDVGTTYTLMYDTSYMGEPMYKLGAEGKKQSGRISGKKIAKAIETGLAQAIKEEVELDEVSMMRKLGRIVGTVTGAVSNKAKDMKADYESWRKVREQIKQAKKDLESVKKEIATADAARDVRAWGKIKELNAQLERLKNEEKERKERLAQATKEEVELDEAKGKVKYLTGPGKKDSKRIIGIYTMGGKWVKDMGTEKEAANFVNKSWGEEVDEVSKANTKYKKIPYFKDDPYVDGPMNPSKKTQARWKDEDTRKPGETWKTASGNFGGKNQHNMVSYFKDETKAKAWASGKTKYKKIPYFKDDPYVDGPMKEEIEQVDEAKPLVGGQKKLDVNKNGKLDAHDFKALRAKKEETEVTEAMNNYIAFYNGKKMTVQAETSYKAQLKAIEMFKAPASKKHMVTVKLAN